MIRSSARRNARLAAALAAITAIASPLDASAQYIDATELVDFDLAADPSDTWGTRFDPRARQGGRWPEPGAADSGWALFADLLAATDRFLTATAAPRELLGEHRWHHAWDSATQRRVVRSQPPGSQLSASDVRNLYNAIADAAEREGLTELYARIPRTHNFNPPGENRPDPGWLQDRIDRVTATLIRVQTARIQRSLDRDDPWTAAATLEQSLTWTRLLREVDPTNATVTAFNPCTDTPPNAPADLTEIDRQVLWELTALETTQAHAPILAAAIAAAHEQQAHARSAQARRLAQTLRADLARRRIALGIDTPDDPGGAAGPSPLAGAAELLTKIETPPGVTVRTIPTTADIQRLMQLFTPQSPPALQDAIDLIADTQGRFDGPAAGLPWLSLVARLAIEEQHQHSLIRLHNAKMIAELCIDTHNQRHASLPITLADLDQDLRRIIPPDPYAPDGRIRARLLRRHTNAYVIYSVGPDGVDDRLSETVMLAQEIPTPNPLTHNADPAELRPAPGTDILMQSPSTHWLNHYKSDLLFSPRFLEDTDR